METLVACSALFLPPSLPATPIASASGLIRCLTDGREIGVKGQSSTNILGRQISHITDESQHIEPSAGVSGLLIQTFQTTHVLSL